MKALLRIILILMIGAFPLTLYFFRSPFDKSTGQNIARSDFRRPDVSRSIPNLPIGLKEIKNLDRSVDSKVRQMRDIDVKITETRGEIIRLEEKKGAARKTLEDLGTRLGPIIDDMERRDPSRASSRLENEDVEFRGGNQ